MTVQEHGDRAQESMRDHVVRRGDGDETLLLGLRGTVDQIVDAFNQRRSEVEECRSGRCQSYGAPAPVKKGRAHLLFQLADMCRYRRLTEVEFDSGLGDAACFRRRAEAPQLSQFHEACTPTYYCEIKYRISYSMPTIDKAHG